MKKFLSIIFILILFSLSGCYSYKEIDSIYIYTHVNYFDYDYERLIDLKNCKLLFYSSEETGKKRNVNEENQGYNIIEELDTEKVEQFKKDISEHGINSWKESYHNYGVMDGSSIEITINYADNTQKTTSVYYEYPDNWETIRNDIFNLTGYYLM